MKGEAGDDCDPGGELKVKTGLKPAAGEPAAAASAVATAVVVAVVVTAAAAAFARSIWCGVGG